MSHKHSRRHLLQQLKSIAADDDQAVAALVRQYFSTEYARLAEEFWQRRDGLETTAAFAKLLDAVIRALCDHVMQGEPASRPFAVAAVGGYGRSCVCPKSDIDLLIIVTPRDAAKTRLINRLIQCLWDTGMKVGHSVRTPLQMIQHAKNDNMAATAMLDARFLWGDQAFFATSWQHFFQKVMRNNLLEFVTAKVDEQRQRHLKFKNSYSVVEPNLKESRGALRDLDMMLWLGKAAAKCYTFSDLAVQGWISSMEARRLQKAQQFMLSMRCALHFITHKPDNTLNFVMQPDMAQRLGYRERSHIRGVERLMKQYHLFARFVSTTNAAVVQQIQQTLQPVQQHQYVGSIGVDLPYFIYHECLTIPNMRTLDHYPTAILKAFLYTARRGYDFSPLLMRAIKSTLHQIDEAFRKDPNNTAMFLEILCHAPYAEKALKLMSDSGVLGAFIPDFARITGLMQYDQYHVYTVDEHTLAAVFLLHRLMHGELRDMFPLASSLCANISNPRILFMAVFLHDIAKGRGGDHSHLGAEIARRLCPLFDFNDSETNMVAWLVEQHLLLSTFALKRDITDTDTLRAFAAEVQTLERLKLLLILTVVDIKATNPSLLNSWKTSLLRELFYAAEDILSGGLLTAGRESRIARLKQDLVLHLSDWDQASIEHWLGILPDSYFLATPPMRQEQHLRWLRSHPDIIQVPFLAYENQAGRDATEIVICAEDQPGMFARITGALSQCQANIVDAQIHTLLNGLILDTFFIQDKGNAFQWPDQLDRMLGKIRLALKDSGMPMGDSLKPVTAKHITPQVVIDNYLSKQYTVVEITAADRPGLLYHLTTWLWQHRVQIASAKISTFGELAVDTFYVRDVFGLKIESPAHLQYLQHGLNTLLSGLPRQDV